MIPCGRASRCNASAGLAAHSRHLAKLAPRRQSACPRTLLSITTKTKRCIALRSYADAALPAQKQQSHNLIRCFSNAVCLEAHTCSHHLAIGVEARTLDPLLTTHSLNTTEAAPRHAPSSNELKAFTFSGPGGPHPATHPPTFRLFLVSTISVCVCILPFL